MHVVHQSDLTTGPGLIVFGVRKSCALGGVSGLFCGSKPKVIGDTSDMDNILHPQYSSCWLVKLWLCRVSYWD